MREQAGVVLLHESLSGHRAEYLRLFRSLIEDAGGTVEQRGLRFYDLMTRKTLFSTMFEEHPLRFGLIALGRTLMGRRSVTLVFRLAEAAHGRSLRMRAKRWLLRMMTRAPGISSVSILPIALDPDFGKVINAWIYDPQLWDEPDTALPPPDQAMLDQAAGRRIVCALGQLNSDKGFDHFCDLWLDSEAIRQRFLFVAAGRVGPGNADRAQAFAHAGGLLRDGFASDEALRGYYNGAHLIWCYYAPGYNQASGIFGRSAQFGRQPLVRAGSYLEGLAQHLGVPALHLEGNAPADTRVLIECEPMEFSGIDRTRLRETSLRQLSKALGLDLH